MTKLDGKYTKLVEEARTEHLAAVARLSELNATVSAARRQVVDLAQQLEALNASLEAFEAGAGSLEMSDSEFLAATDKKRLLVIRQRHARAQLATAERPLEAAQIEVSFGVNGLRGKVLDVFDSDSAELRQQLVGLMNF